MDPELLAAIDLLRGAARALRKVAGRGHDAEMAGLARSSAVLRALELSALGFALAGSQRQSVEAFVALVGALHEQRGDRRTALEGLAVDVEASAEKLAKVAEAEAASSDLPN